MRKEKDYSTIREGDSAYVQHQASRGALRDYTLKHQVTVEWHLNEEARMDKMFKLKIDDLEVILDGEQVLSLLRWV